jgi:hypothetical protein
MSEADIAIELTRDQALVLSEWLYRVIGTEELDSLIGQDRAVWSPLHAISATLETSLVEVLMPDYKARLDAARERLSDQP